MLTTHLDNEYYQQKSSLSHGLPSDGNRIRRELRFKQGPDLTCTDILFTFSHVQIQAEHIKTKSTPTGCFLFLAAGEGFEPSHTESESAVLPLHNPAKGIDYYTQIQNNVKDYLPLSQPQGNN